MSPRILVFCLLFVFSATGCVYLNGKKQLPDLPLLPPGDFFTGGMGSSEGEQFLEQVTLINGEEEQVMLAAWVVNKSHLDLVGLTPTGQRLLQLHYDGSDFTEEYSLLLEQPIPGRMVLAHLQLAHWPEQSIQKAFGSSPWVMKTITNQRQFYIGDQQIMTVGFDSDLIRIDNEAAGFNLIVKKLKED